MFLLTLANSCLTSSTLPWFVDLTFQFLTQYRSLQHWILLSPPDTTTVGCRFHFGSGSSFLVVLFLHSSPVAYWTPTDLKGSSFSVVEFCLFTLFMGFSRQECWSGLPLPSPVDHEEGEWGKGGKGRWMGPWATLQYSCPSVCSQDIVLLMGAEASLGKLSFYPNVHLLSLKAHLAVLVFCFSWSFHCIS